MNTLLRQYFLFCTGFYPNAALCLILGMMIQTATVGQTRTRLAQEVSAYAALQANSQTAENSRNYSRTVYLKTTQRLKTGNAAYQQLQKVVSELHCTSLRMLCENDVFAAVTCSQNASIEGLCRAFEQRKSIVEYAELAQNLAPHQTPVATPNDPLFPRQYHIDRVRVREAWSVLHNTPQSSRQADSTLLLAVCDTGTDWEHEDLAANIWSNPGESGRDAQGRDKSSNGVDDDRNGKIDDWHGWDFVGAVSEDERAAGIFREDNDPKPRINPSLDPTELLHHGTHVASTLAALTDNNKGGVGIAHGCRILPVKCASDGTRVGGISRAYEAVLYAAQMGAKVIVCSFGGGRYSRFEQDIINTVNAMGALVVVSAGNDAKITDDAEYPASYDNVLCVGASNQADRAASFSDAGVKVHVFAPGEALLSAILGNQYSSEWSGTSMAAPVVAGIAALLRLQNPTWTPRQITQQLRATSDNVLLGQIAGRSLTYFGRVNALNALVMRPPGLTLTQTSIGAASGIVQDAQPFTLTLQCTNILAPAQNVRLTLFSLDGRASILTQTLTLGNLSTNESRTVTVRVQLDPAAMQGASAQGLSSQGTGLRSARFVAVLQADSYINYEYIAVPYNLRFLQGSQMLASGVLDFGQTAIAKKLSLEVKNIGSDALSLGAVRLSGANANDFVVQTPSPTIAGGASMLIPVEFAPAQGFAGGRTATLSLTAQTQGMVTLSGVQGGYDFSTIQGTYNEFLDGTTLRNGIVPFDDAEFSLSLGFPFVFNGTTHDRLTASSNGFCAFAPEASLVAFGAPVLQPMRSSVRANGYIAAFAANLIASQTNASQASADVRYKTEGTSPNRVFVLQWRNVNAKTVEGRTDSSVVLNVQLRLHETSNRVEVVFGKCISARFMTGEIGLRGSSFQDFHSRRISDDIAASWANSAEARSNEDDCEMTSQNVPTQGLTFRWQPLTTPRTRAMQTLTTSTELRASVPMTISSVVETMTQKPRECLVLPNPARDEATVRFLAESAQTAQISIKNSLGAELWQTSSHAHSGENTVALPVRGLPSGVYFVTVTMESDAKAHQTLQQRLLVVR